LKPDYHEDDRAHQKPAGLVKKHAIGKALSVVKKIKNEF